MSKLPAKEKIVWLILRLFLPLFVRGKDSRKNIAYQYCRIFISIESIKSYFALKKITMGAADNSVVIFEPTDFHGEVVSGMLGYFTELHFDKIIVLLTPIQYKSRPVYIENSSIMIFPVDDVLLSMVLRLKNLRASLYFMTTLYFRHVSVARYTRNNKHVFSRLYGFVHEASQLTRDRIPELREKGRTFVLNNFSNTLSDIKPLSAIYFKNATFIQHLKHSKVRLLSIGAHSKNSLFDAVSRLKETGLSVEVAIAARNSIEVPDNLANVITLYTNLDYKCLFEEVEKCDFLLSLLDSTDPEDRVFLDHGESKSTGNIQLSLGFNKPIVIEENFAQRYGLDHRSAVIYKPNDLTSALECAIRMDDFNYAELQNRLAEIATNRKADGLQLLRKVL